VEKDVATVNAVIVEVVDKAVAVVVGMKKAIVVIVGVERAVSFDAGVTVVGTVFAASESVAVGAGEAVFSDGIVVTIPVDLVSTAVGNVFVSFTAVFLICVAVTVIDSCDFARREGCDVGGFLADCVDTKKGI
jgi:hypothetical protein